MRSALYKLRECAKRFGAGNWISTVMAFIALVGLSFQWRENQRRDREVADLRTRAGELEKEVEQRRQSILYLLEHLDSEERDILDSLKRHELGITVQDPLSGHQVAQKYGDPRLARAEEYLSDIPRPWTVPKMIGIFKTQMAWPRKVGALPTQTHTEAEEWTRQWQRESKRCEYLARVLAASRDPRAAVALGDTFDTWYPDKPLVMDALFAYFVVDMDYGLPPDDKLRNADFAGNLLDLIIPATTRWWNDNKARLREEAAALGKDE